MKALLTGEKALKRLQECSIDADTLTRQWYGVPYHVFVSDAIDHVISYIFEMIKYLKNDTTMSVYLHLLGEPGYWGRIRNIHELDGSVFLLPAFGTQLIYNSCFTRNGRINATVNDLVEYAIEIQKLHSQLQGS